MTTSEQVLYTTGADGRISYAQTSHSRGRRGWVSGSSDDIRSVDALRLAAEKHFGHDRIELVEVTKAKLDRFLELDRRYQPFRSDSPDTSERILYTKARSGRITYCTDYFHPGAERRSAVCGVGARSIESLKTSMVEHFGHDRIEFVEVTEAEYDAHVKAVSMAMLETAAKRFALTLDRFVHLPSKERLMQAIVAEQEKSSDCLTLDEMRRGWALHRMRQRGGPAPKKGETARTREKADNAS